MNRITAVLLAMVALLVHALAIHRDALEAFAPAFDSAHVAFAMGRNLVDAGAAAPWVAPDGSSHVGGMGSYPSPLLVLLSAALELLGVTVDRVAQVVGLLCALATVYLSTRFDTDRIAGVVPALLLVASGAVAAAGASGTEWPIAMFALVLAFVALEHGRASFSAIGLVMLVTVRPEGLFAAAALALMNWTRRRRGSAPLERHRPPRMWVFLPALAALAGAHAAGAPLLRDALGMLAVDGSAARHGAAQLLDLWVVTVTPALLVFPLVALARGSLSAVGARALIVTGVWTVAAIAGGGGPSTYGLAFAPALPIAFIAIQQGMARALDTYRRSMERLVWVSLAVTLVPGVASSRFPGDLGPLRVGHVQERVYRANAAVPPGRSPLLGRAALYSEVRLTRGLREIGALLGRRLTPDTTVLSPWPGVLQWEMDARVVDVFGRTAPLTPGRDVRRWSPEPGGVDVLAALATEPDFILPAPGALQDHASGAAIEVLPGTVLELAQTDAAERDRVRAALARYELLVTPGRGPGVADGEPAVLLARRSGTGPELEVLTTATPDEVRFDAIFAEHPRRSSSPPQYVDAALVAVLEDGSNVAIGPRGEALTVGEGGAAGLAVSGALVDPRWPTPVTVARFDPGRAAERLGQGIVRVELRLLHHRVDPAELRADAAAPVSVQLDR